MFLQMFFLELPIWMKKIILGNFLSGYMRKHFVGKGFG